jgi:RDD family
VKKARPWIRFWARMFDYTIPFTVLVILLDTGSPVWREFQWLNGLWVWFLATIVWIPIEAICVSAWGTTPGKALLNTRVTRTPYPVALKRSAIVWLHGMGAGVVIVSQVMWIISFRRLARTQTTPWDRATGSHVTHGRVGSVRAVSMIALWIFLDLLGFSLAGWFVSTFLFMPETSLQWPT